MSLTLDRPRGEIIPIIAKLLDDKALEDGEEYEYIPMEEETSAQFPTPKKGGPVIPQLVGHFKSHQMFELKQLMTAISKEMDDRHVTHKSPSKPDASGFQPQDVSSILYSLIKEGALRTNIPKLSVFSGEILKGEASLSSGLMNCRPSGRLTASQP